MLGFSPISAATLGDDNGGVAPVPIESKHYFGLLIGGPLASAPLADDGVGAEGVVVSPVGVEATASPGSVTVSADANVSPSGLEATASPGSVTVSTDANVVVLGAQARGLVSGVFIWSRLDPDTNPDWTLVDPDTNPDWTDVAA